MLQVKLPGLDLKNPIMPASDVLVLVENLRNTMI